MMMSAAVSQPLSNFPRVGGYMSLPVDYSPSGSETRTNR